GSDQERIWDDCINHTFADPPPADRLHACELNLRVNGHDRRSYTEMATLLEERGERARAARLRRIAAMLPGRKDARPAGATARRAMPWPGPPLAAVQAQPVCELTAASTSPSPPPSSCPRRASPTSRAAPRRRAGGEDPRATRQAARPT